MPREKLTVVIPAAGLGSRLTTFTKNYSKAMCTVGKLPVVSHIINQFNHDDEIIVLLGYKGDLLKQVINACHPDMNITFIEVDKYDGDGSGLGYSLSCAYHLLQRPFMFWCCDTLLPTFNINLCDYNKDWSVVSACSDNFDSYRHMKVNGSNHVIGILPKDVPRKHGIYSYVGVSFVHSYNDFWKAWHDNQDNFIAHGEVCGLMNLHRLDAYFTDKWIDTGNRESLEQAKREYSSNMDETVLEKPDEAIWFFNDKVVKFHIDPKFIADRVERFSTCLCEKQKLNGIQLPQLISYSKNVYVYKRADGIIASKVITPKMLDDILNSYLDMDYIDVDEHVKEAIYNDFYKCKTLSRIAKYCKECEDIDGDCKINGMNCQSATQLIERLDWDRLSHNGIFTNNYHGDFHLENILVNGNSYVMLDWRQNFGKTMIGDAYYDIAKMWHSLIVNHNMVRDNLFSVENTDEHEVRIDIHRTFIDTECEETLKNYIRISDKYDYAQSELLTAVIFLNIAACHVYPYSRFLFYLGKLMINKFYNTHKEFWNEQ